MPRHDFATAVKGATPDQLRDRVGCAYLIYTAQGVRAAGLQLGSPNTMHESETPGASTRQYL